ncbi:MAG: molecular chaperone DnaK [Hyphomicrobiales bacterium]|nr:MAG: molecular chaperone DnaK [Hyphomicrobiales bacterium]
MFSFDKAHKLLTSIQLELKELQSISKAASAPVMLDQQSVGRLSRMDAIRDQAMAQEADRRRRLELQKIEAAFNRLASDNYGICLGCEEEIAEKRLEVDPTATLCIACASQE